jgi:hypothetical protein
MGSKEGRGPQTDKHLPPSTSTGLFSKKSRHLRFLLLILKIVSITLFRELVAAFRKHQ